MQLRYAKRIDFTSSYADFDHFQQFDQNTVELIRLKEKAEVVIVIDRAYGFSKEHAGSAAECHLVSDHLNLTGDNPLVGPNNPIGERFPVVNNIYLSAADTIDQVETWTMGNPLSKLRSGIAAGVKPGLDLAAADLETIHSLGAHFYCFNTVQTMIVAAHAGLKVLALAVPDGGQLSDEIVLALRR